MPASTPSTLWQHAGFRRLYASTLCFSLATRIYELAMPLILYELTRSASAMASMRAVELLPNLLLAMFIGVWVDRFDRALWARLAMAGMVVLMGIQAWMLGQGTEGGGMLPYFYACAFALMTLNYLYSICRMGMVKDMLPAHLLLPATGQLSVVNELFGVLGPMLAGLVLAWHLELGLWLPMGALLLAAYLQRNLQLPLRATQPQAYWSAWREGWGVLVRNRPLWHLAWLVVLTNGSAGVVEVLFLFRARDQLNLGPGEIGLMFGLAGLGGVAAGLYASRLRQRLGLGRLIALAFALEALCILPMAWAQAVPVLLLALCVNSFAAVVGNVCIWGYRQESTESHHIGRISGLTGSLFKLLMPISLVLSGLLANGQTLVWLMTACAVLHGVAVLGARVSSVYRVA